MSIRRLIVEIDPSTINVTRFCAEHGISTWFFWDLRRRFSLEGDKALTPRSRAPRRVANKTPIDIEDAVVAKRKELLDAGHDAGPASIAFELRHLEGLPSESTIWRRLKSRGFIVDDPSKAPKGSRRRFTATRANESWQLDDTTWALADGTEVKVFNVIDDHSRLNVAATAMATCTGSASLRSLAAAAAVLGWPQRIQSDNAKAFRHTLTTALAELGIAAAHSRPHHPQTNGKVERFHQTQKRWLTNQHPADDIDGLQAQLDVFRFHYNHLRSHRGINRQIPAEVWTSAPKSGPADRALTPTSIHTSIVIRGRITVGSRYTISIGNRWEHREALTVISGTNCHVFIDGTLARHLTLDPTRRTQPLHPPTERNAPRHP
jgi:transposase InsO family protein